VEKLKLDLRTQRKQEMERRKALASNIAAEAQDWKRAVKEVREEKARTAQQLKAEVQRLELEARKREEIEKLERHQRIQEIQAAKIILKKMSQSEIPRNIRTANSQKLENKELIQVREMKLQHTQKFFLIVHYFNAQNNLTQQRKLAQEADVEATRRRIHAMKQEKMDKLHHARLEIERHKNDMFRAKVREKTEKARSEIFPDYVSQNSADVALMANNDTEIDNLMSELKKWKTENALARKPSHISINNDFNNHDHH